MPPVSPVSQRPSASLDIGRWQAMTEAGYLDDGAPGPRPRYSPDYYGAFVIDPGGNSAEAVHQGPPKHSGMLDHLWLRVAGLADSTRFYETLVPIVGHQTNARPDRTTSPSEPQF